MRNKSCGKQLVEGNFELFFRFVFWISQMFVNLHSPLSKRVQNDTWCNPPALRSGGQAGNTERIE